MNGGLISLAISGNKDLYLINNPNITFFKKVYHKTSNFHIEPVKQYFNNDFEFNKKISCNLSKIGDLLSSIYLYIKLPKINKYIDPLTNKVNRFIRFAWAKKIGFAIIKEINIEIGNYIIETLYCDCLNIWYELSETMIKKNIDNMIGNHINNYSFSSTKNEYELYIPLYFWFKKIH